MKVVVMGLCVLMLLYMTQPSSAQPIAIPVEADAAISTNVGCPGWQTTNYGTLPVLHTMEWTWFAINCAQGTIRTLLRFNLNLPPDNRRLYDNRARLLMFFPTGSTETHWFVGAATDNRFFIERLTQPWGELTANWNNQPAATAVNSVLIPSSVPNPSTLDYNMDVSGMVGDRYCNGIPNFGMRFRMQTEGVTFRRVTFTSREWADVNRRPTLVMEFARITAAAPDSVCADQSFSINCILNNAANPSVYTFEWTHLNSGTTYDTQEVTDPASVLGLNTYQVTVRNPWCETATDTIQVWVKPVTVTSLIYHD